MQKNLGIFKPQMTVLLTAYKGMLHKQIDGNGNVGTKTVCWRIGSNITQGTAMQSSFRSCFER